MKDSPLVVINTVGLTPRLLPLAPSLSQLAARGWSRPLTEVLPSVTCTSQATMLTGKLPTDHGIVGNGWYFRDTGEIRFWLQSNKLIQAEPFYETARRLAQGAGREFRSAKLFWWYNQGAAVDLSVTPKPYYGADGSKAFGISGSPMGLTERLESSLGTFPFHTFWGPNAGLACSEWIGRCAAEILDKDRPDLSLVYLPHLDYDLQRFGLSGSDLPRVVGELDRACEPILDAATKVGARVWVVNEYGHRDVSRPVYLNRELRQAGLLSVRPGPFGEILESFQSRAFAVCDHQLAHVYVQSPGDLPHVRRCLESMAGVARVIDTNERASIGLDHERAGDLIVLSDPDAWFAYPFWLDDRQAPDFARSVDIHRKAGYDPCELFFDPKLAWPKGRVVRRLIQKKLGFRTLFDVVPLNASLVRGSHGLVPQSDEDRPILIGDGVAPSGGSPLPMTDIRDLVLGALGF